jgi:hypothetical protein
LDQVCAAVDWSRAFGYKASEIHPIELGESGNPTLSGSEGPSFLNGGHVTRDYNSRRIGVSYSPLPKSIAGFRTVALVRSTRHPSLIVVRGSIAGREILIELDTGKSRAAIDPAFAEELGLTPKKDKFRPPSVRIGGLPSRLSRLVVADRNAFDSDLAEPILISLGSDELSRFVWTVDYDAGVLWIPVSPVTLDSQATE